MTASPGTPPLTGQFALVSLPQGHLPHRKRRERGSGRAEMTGEIGPVKFLREE